MKNAFPIQCPTCGSERTLRIKGLEGLCPTCLQQRHQCSTCGQRFLAFWEVAELRPYGAQPAVEGADAGA